MGTAIQVSVVIAAIVCAVCAIYFSVRDENPRNKLALCFFGLMALFVSSSLYFEFCGFGVLGEGAGASVVTVYRNGEWTSSRWGAFELGEEEQKQNHLGAVLRGHVEFLPEKRRKPYRHTAQRASEGKTAQEPKKPCWRPTALGESVAGTVAKDDKTPLSNLPKGACEERLRCTF
jgi:hypothetical protein